MLQRAYRYRLYPTKEQRIYFSKCFGSVRFLWNKMLADRIECYEKYGNDKEHSPRSYTSWKKDYNWLYEIDALALANVYLQLNAAYRRFFCDKQVGFPNFKSKRARKDRYTTNNQNNNIRIENGRVKLPKIGWVKVVDHRVIPEDAVIKSCTISLTPSGKYFISMLTERPFEQPSLILDKEKTLGLDYSSPHFYTDSQGVEANYPRFYRRSESSLQREQHKLSKMRKGSKNREKQRTKVARAHERIANQRKDWLHKESRRIVGEWDYVAVEDINLRGLAGALRFGKSTNDNGFGMFRTFLRYKLEEQGKQLVVVDKWFPSSKLCPVCENTKKELSLSDRIYKCDCGYVCDRDINAANNIRDWSMRNVG